MDKTQIEKQAKEIMDNFLAALGREEFHCDIGSERKNNMRENGKNEENLLFRKRMLKNAPKTNGEYIQAEKKKW